MSSNVVVLILDPILNALLLTPTTIIRVGSYFSTPEAAANSMRQAAPPTEVKIALIMFAFQTLEFRKRCVQALQNEGYTNIESIDIRTVELSSTISDLSLNCTVGEPVFVNLTDNYSDLFQNHGMVVIQRCKEGWKVFEKNQQPLHALSNYPSTRNIVIYKKSPKTIVAEVKKLFPDLTLHFCEGMRENYNIAYMRSRGNENLLHGNVVLPYCDVKLIVGFSNKKETILLTSHVPPFTIERKVDIGNASHVTVYGLSISDSSSLLELEKISFNNKVARKVLITVNVDKTLIPVVKMTTVSIYKPRNYETPVIYSVWMQKNEYFLFAVFEDDVSNYGAYQTAADVITHIKKSSSATATKAVYFLYACENTIRQIQKFRDTFAAAQEYPPVKLLFSDSMTLSLSFDRAKVFVLPGQTVAVVSPNVVYVVQRNGELLKALDMCLLQNFDINNYSVDKVIIDNDKNVFTISDLEYLRLKYFPRAVKVLQGIEFLESPLPKFFWSRVNETDYSGNFFNNFGCFFFHIEGDGFSQTLDNRFWTIPYTAIADLRVGNAKTLDVKLSRGVEHTEVLQKFSVPNGAKAARFTICVKSACDITVAMDVIDEIVVIREQQKLKAIESRRQDNPKAVDLLVQFGTKCYTDTLTVQKTPFIVIKKVDVEDASEVTVRAFFRGKIDATPVIKTIKFKKSAFRKVAIIVNVDEHYATKLTLRTASIYEPIVQVTQTLDTAYSQLNLNPEIVQPTAGFDAGLRKKPRASPKQLIDKMVDVPLPLSLNNDAAAETHDDEINTDSVITSLTFTSDNRVLIEAGETYTGDKEFPAYVRIQSGKAPEVGQEAFDAMKARRDNIGGFGQFKVHARLQPPTRENPFLQFLHANCALLKLKNGGAKF